MDCTDARMSSSLAPTENAFVIVDTPSPETTDLAARAGSSHTRCPSAARRVARWSTDPRHCAKKGIASPEDSPRRNAAQVSLEDWECCAFGEILAGMKVETETSLLRGEFYHRVLLAFRPLL